jgi:hypothetical protein
MEGTNHAEPAGPGSQQRDGHGGRRAAAGVGEGVVGLS